MCEKGSLYKVSWIHNLKAAFHLKYSPTHHEELAESDMWEDVVGFVFATGDPALLPEVGQLIL